MSIRPTRRSVRPSPVFLAIVAITAVGGVLAWLAGAQSTPIAYLGTFTFVVAGWLVSLCLHEFGHAFTAWRYGDQDVELRGYLTLNPIRYANPWLSLGIPALFIALGGIGLPGGAVYLRDRWMSAGRRTAISLAGPLANVVLAVLLLVVARAMWDLEHAVFWGAVAFLGFLQITAVLLNLLPIPGLDGYGALEPHLRPETQRALEPVKNWGFLILFVLLLAPLLNNWFFALVLWFFDLSGVPAAFVSVGMNTTRFWTALF